MQFSDLYPLTAELLKRAHNWTEKDFEELETFLCIIQKSGVPFDLILEEIQEIEDCDWTTASLEDFLDTARRAVYEVLKLSRNPKKAVSSYSELLGWLSETEEWQDFVKELKSLCETEFTNTEDFIKQLRHIIFETERKYQDVIKAAREEFHRQHIKPILEVLEEG